MKSVLLLLALAGCTMERPQPISEPDSTEQPWFCEDYKAKGGEAPRGCVHEPRRSEISVPRSEWLLIERRLCGENGSVSWDEDGPVCSRPDSRCEFLKRFVKEAPHLAAVIRAANEVDQIIDDLSLSGNGEDVIVGLTMEAEEILKGPGCD